MSQPIVFDRRADADKAIWEKLDALTKALDSLAQDALRVNIVYPARTFKNAVINESTSGDKTIVTAVSGKCIKVAVVVLNVAGTVSLTWKSGSTAKSGAMPFQAREGYVASVTPPAYVQATAAGEALVLNLSAAIAVTGWLTYWDNDNS